ncbi:NAD(P)H-dependent oxidoreductase [Methylorubrum rhodesianum]|jgi:putative NADPH-quinone reductase|uniref:NAD(P)H-dependent oxidoreductase n=1 Tax=Methylorubrum rhodesianum TaxID=29427 RepID=A0ABU9ZEA9_9HYPH|nr:MULTISPECIES: NAD(P)H-dependent oxidoreductase [Methylorubrum]MBB5762964.1 putative NADPH-quinone reductase [Methylorubrum rhodesianum]MBI1688746.1 flavodoxin family protein [Methylorubrum sp. DB1722]MBK3404813.1 NAD(P)H-dependent oxidoreductase [Methylorubrum rhodesianum]MBY0142810.1 NAD(P)H-dependent oxidoreductase [Methylorubrum populi]
MRVLLVHCHPRSDSFNTALRGAAASALHAAGHEVESLDLYEQNFDPRLSARERRAYYDESADRPDIAGHIAALRRAEALVLVYPTWWFGPPAMLKGWFDRVWLPGIAFALGGAKVLQPRLTNIRRITVVTTYGSPRWLLWLVGWPDWRMFRFGIRPLCARRCRLDWIALTGMDRASEPVRARFVAQVRKRLAAL